MLKRGILSVILLSIAIFFIVSIASNNKSSATDNKAMPVEEQIKKFYKADSVSVQTINGVKQYIVVRTIDGSLYGLMKETALDIKSMCQHITEEKMLPSDSTVKFISKVGLIDKYGKEYKEDAIEFVFSIKELNKVVKWINLLPQNVLELADTMKATPVGWEVMARQLKRDPDDYKDYVGILERMARAN